MKKYEQISIYLQYFLDNEVRKTGLNRVVLGLSGGLDSAVVAVLAHKVFQDDLLCVKMPSQYSSSGSLDDADELCEKFDMNSVTVSIAPMLKVYEDLNPNMNNLRKGNFSSRLDRKSVV